MKRIHSFAAFAAAAVLLASALLQGCSEATRDSMGRDVNRTAAKVDDKLD